MDLRQQRNQNREAILEGRYITQVLQENAKELNQDIEKRVSGFRSEFFQDREISVNDNVMTYRHSRGLRFVDMKRRDSETGKKNKRSHAVHNKPIYGHANEIVRDLTVGYTDAVREEMMKLDGTQI